MPSLACAHDLWLERDGAAFVLHRGHRHSAHAGNELVRYPPAFVREAVCIDANGAPQPAKSSEVHPVRIEAECAVLAVRFSSGYWTKTAWETRNLPKTGLSGVVKSWLSEETVKRVERWSPAAALPVSGWLEIVPAQDPRAIAPGQKLTVRVFQAGAPLAGVAVAYDGSVRGTTAADGSIALRLHRPGLQMISASVETPLTDGKADTLVRAATLNFDLAGK